MHIFFKEWQKLNIAIFTLVLSLIVAGGFIVGAVHFKNAQANSLAKQHSLAQAAEQKLQSSGVEKAMIVQYLRQYQSLIARGFVGEERRIEWVDLLREAHKKHKLFSVSYAIHQQEPFSPPFATQLGSFSLHRSAMQLDLDMLHEGDIVNLMGSIKDAATTPFLLRECVITRLTAQPNRRLVANLHASCALDWLTLREPGTLQAN